MLGLKKHLEPIVKRFEELQNLLATPQVASDRAAYSKYAKELARLKLDDFISPSLAVHHANRRTPFRGAPRQRASEVTPPPFGDGQPLAHKLLEHATGRPAGHAEPNRQTPLALKLNRYTPGVTDLLQEVMVDGVNIAHRTP